MAGWDGGVTTIYFAPDQTDEAPPARFYFKVREEGWVGELKCKDGLGRGELK